MPRFFRIVLAAVVFTAELARAGVRTEIAHALPPQTAPALDLALDALDHTIASEKVTTNGHLVYARIAELQLAHVITLLAQNYSAERDAAIQALGRAIATMSPDLAQTVAKDFASKDDYEALLRMARRHEPVPVPSEPFDYIKGPPQMITGAVGTAALPLTIVVMFASLLIGIVGTLAGEAAAADFFTVAGEAAAATTLADEESKSDNFTSRAWSFAKGGYLRMTDRRRMIDVVKTMKPSGGVARTFCAALLAHTEA